MPENRSETRADHEQHRAHLLPKKVKEVGLGVVQQIHRNRLYQPYNAIQQGPRPDVTGQPGVGKARFQEGFGHRPMQVVLREEGEVPLDALGKVGGL